MLQIISGPLSVIFQLLTLFEQDEVMSIRALSASLQSRYKISGDIIEYHSIPVIFTVMIFASVVAFGTAIGVVSYDINEMNPIFGELAIVWFCGLACQYINLDGIGQIFKYISIFFFSMILSMMASLVLAKACFPYIDSILFRIDKIISFGTDWPALVRSINSHENLSFLLNHAYMTLNWQPFFIFIWFLATDRKSTAWTITSALSVGSFICVILFPFTPAISGFDFYGLSPTDIPNITVHSTWAAIDLLQDIRNGVVSEVSMTHLAGMISVPSFHATAAIVLAWGYYQSRLLRWPFLLINFVMLISTVPVGGHYFIDVVAGIFVGWLSIMFVNRWNAKRSDWQDMSATVRPASKWKLQSMPRSCT